MPRRRQLLLGAIAGALASNAAWLIGRTQVDKSEPGFEISLEFDRVELENQIVSTIDETTDGRAAAQKLWNSEEYGFSIVATESASEALVGIAANCEIRKWMIDEMHGHVDLAFLRMHTSDLNREKFSCLAKYARSPFVRFSAEPFD